MADDIVPILLDLAQSVENDVKNPRVKAGGTARAGLRNAARWLREAAEQLDGAWYLRTLYNPPAKHLPAGLPVPRLQLRWEAQGRGGESLCFSELVLPLREHDIRRENEDGEYGPPAFVVGLGCTRVGFGGTPSWAYPSPADRTPFRAGAHANWDSAALGDLPVYVVSPDGAAALVPPNPQAREDARRDFARLHPAPAPAGDDAREGK